MNIRLALLLALIFSLTMACNRSPKVIVASKDTDFGEHNHVIFTEQVNKGADKATNEDLHIVVVNEILPTTKYVYLKVTEGNEQFWIATTKQAVVEGGKYYYKGGLLKTNFKSTEHNRVFDKVYLVSGLVPENHGNENEAMEGVSDPWKDIKTGSEKNDAAQSNITPDPKNSIKIAELVEDSKRYEGEIIQISGKCVKVNPNIMGRNWIHLKDGSRDDFDLVITSSAFVEVGAIVTMSGIVAINKDFGAGYKYDIILENGAIIP